MERFDWMVSKLNFKTSQSCIIRGKLIELAFALIQGSRHSTFRFLFHVPFLFFRFYFLIDCNLQFIVRWYVFSPAFTPRTAFYVEFTFLGKISGFWCPLAPKLSLVTRNLVLVFLIWDCISLFSRFLFPFSFLLFFPGKLRLSPCPWGRDLTRGGRKCEDSAINHTHTVNFTLASGQCARGYCTSVLRWFHTDHARGCYSFAVGPVIRLECFDFTLVSMKCVISLRNGRRIESWCVKGFARG